MEGGIYFIDKVNYVFSCLLIPRKKLLENNANANKKTIKALDRIYHVKKSTNRSKSRIGVSTTNCSYSTYGRKVLQGRRDFSQYDLEEDGKNTHKTILKFVT